MQSPRISTVAAGAPGSRTAFDRNSYRVIVAGAAEQGTPEEFFDGFPDGLSLYQAIAQTIRQIGPATVRVTKSQIAFRRRKGFAFVWRPGQYVRSDVPAVLSLVLPYEIASHRFKSVVHPAAGVWMHHLELRTIDEVDDEVRGWLNEAYRNAG